ncbi:MAG: DUF444 family protein [Patescibacteria group bacterium]
MPIIVPSPTAYKGSKDARRHREKQKELVKQRIPDIIADENIITQKKGKIIKVRIKRLQNPHIRQGKRPIDDENQGEENGSIGGGIGQGSGKSGDIIRRQPGENEPGIDELESEMEIEELISMMLEDLGLPNLEEKDVKDLEIIAGITVSGVTHTGPWSLLHVGKTKKEGFKRFYHYLHFLMKETERLPHECYDALKNSEGILEDALKLLKSKDFVSNLTPNDELQPFIIAHQDDLRFLKVEEDIEFKSRAVLLAMMDVSGSMYTEKKYLVRSLLFWIIELLRKSYKEVAVRFIIHHSQARLVDEDDFFHTLESGGTLCYTAYEIANDLVDTEYPTNSWNVYSFHFSDGDDFNPQRTVEEAHKLIQKGVQMVAYGEVNLNPNQNDYSGLIEEFTEKFPLIKNIEEKEITVYAGEKDFPFLAVKIENKEQIWPAIKEFLKKTRWVKS